MNRAARIQDAENAKVQHVMTSAAEKARKRDVDISADRIICAFAEAGATKEQQVDRLSRLFVRAGERLVSMIGPDDALPILSRPAKDAGYRISTASSKAASNDELARVFKGEGA